MEEGRQFDTLPKDDKTRVFIGNYVNGNKCNAVWQSTQGFLGQISQFRLWDEILSDSEIEDEFKVRGITRQPIVSWKDVLETISNKNVARIARRVPFSMRKG